MKKYRLKQWYPSLDSCWEVEDIAYYYRNGVYWNDTRIVENGVSAKEVENNPDFWELIEDEKPNPLFITEDGVEVYEGDKTIPVDIITWKKYFAEDNNGLYEHFKYFKHESNADKYIEENKPKPLFTTDDGVDVFDRDEYFAIGYDFNKRNMIAYNCDAPYSTGVIRFKNESNADEYIIKNKRLFTYEEMKKANVDINWCTADIYYKAIERSKQ